MRKVWDEMTKDEQVASRVKNLDHSCASDILNDRKRGLWNKISASTADATMGRVKSAKKAKSSAENGRKGGRPKKEIKENIGE